MAEYFSAGTVRAHGAVGDRRMDFDEVVRLAEKYCGAVERVNAPREQPQPLLSAAHRHGRPEAQPPVHDGA